MCIDTYLDVHVGMYLRVLCTAAERRKIGTVTGEQHG